MALQNFKRHHFPFFSYQIFHLKDKLKLKHTLEKEKNEEEVWIYILFSTWSLREVYILLPFLSSKQTP